MLNGIIRWSIDKQVHCMSYKKLFRLYEHLFRRHNPNTSKQIGLISWRYRHKEIHPRDYYNKTAYLEFAGQTLPVPYKYKEWLSDYYGPDYLTPKKAPNMHGSKYLDAETPYNESMTLLKEHPELFQSRLALLYQ